MDPARSPNRGGIIPAQPPTERGAESSASSDPPDESIPWQQRFYQKIWIWAVAAILFWFLSYVVWGSVELMLLPEG